VFDSEEFIFMQRFLTALFATAITVASAYAGEIQIGPGGNGLCSTCSGSVLSANGFSEQGYDVRLFEGAVPAPTVASTYTDTTNGILFDSIGGDGAGKNFWQGNGSAPSITIAVGVLGPQSVWTMLNDVFGLPGAKETTVQFNFVANGTPDPIVFTLTNANNNGVTGGQIEASIDCSSTTNTATPNCMSFAGADGSALLSGAGNSDQLTPTGTSTVPVNVLTSTVFTQAYTSITNSGAYTLSAGNLYLDDQGFIFAGTKYANEYLTSITVQDLSGTPNVSQTALSAITVVTPEPSTIFMVLAGFGVLGASRLRRRAAK
jgi:hypothetical protein